MYVTTLYDYFNCIAINRPIFRTQYFTKVMTSSGNSIYSGSTTLNLKNVLKLVLVEIYLKGYVPSDDPMYRNIIYVNRHSGRQLYKTVLYHRTPFFLARKLQHSKF
jgi:hypothetical protein